MHLSARNKHLRACGKSFLAWALMLLLCLCTIAAGSSALHEKLHSDHSSPTHACLLSTLEKGLGNGPAEAPAIFLRPQLLLVSITTDADAPHAADFRPFHERGPPCLS